MKSYCPDTIELVQRIGPTGLGQPTRVDPPYTHGNPQVDTNA